MTLDDSIQGFRLRVLREATAASWLPLAWPDARDGVSRGHCR